MALSKVVGDLQLGNQKVTLNHLVAVIYEKIRPKMANWKLHKHLALWNWGWMDALSVSY